MEIQSLEDVQMHRITLAFQGDLEQQFLKYYSDDTHRQIRIALLLALFFGVAYQIVDTRLFPSVSQIESNFLNYLYYPLVALCFLSIQHKSIRCHTQLVTAFVVILQAVGIISIIHAAGNDVSVKNYYFQGLLLCIAFGFSVCRLRFVYSTMTSLCVASIYILTTLLWSENWQEDIEFLNNTADIVLFIILGMITTYLLEQYSRVGFVKNIIIENKQKEMLRLELSLEKERMKREIHDGVSPEFTGILAFTERLRTGEEEFDRELLCQIENSARRGLQELRNIMLVLGPESMTIDYFSRYVQRYTGDLLSSKGLQLEVLRNDSCEQHALSADNVLNIFRIIQEACQNIIKHAEAIHVRMSFIVNDAEFSLSIEDDGQGFDATVQHIGFGLENMKRRSEKFGGKCAVTSSPGKGTTVKYSLPIN